MKYKYDVKRAHYFSNNHRPELENDNMCGCFCCLKIFTPKQIEEWVVVGTPADWRGTAICPYCDVDAVIGESSGYPITKEFLKEMNLYWFDGYT